MYYKFHSNILREYDIRGVIDETLTESDSKTLGHLLGLKLKGNKIVNVGYDGRNSSIKIKKALISGLVEAGAYVKEIGLGPTPMLYFACYNNEAELGIMVTGSHNPKNHNGFKIVMNNRPFFGSDILNLQNEAADYSLNREKGNEEKFNVKEIYSNFLKDSFNIHKMQNITWDSGNGAAGDIIKTITSYLNGSQNLLFCEIDGNFPNHHPDPSEEKNLKDLKNSVLKNKCDFGIAFDGDGDRIGIVDNLGRTVPGDLILLLLAEDILKSNKNASIIADVKCSQVVFDRINKFGGKAIISKTGHSNIKLNMKKHDAIFAGEMSGHMFFADNYFGFDDALYAAVRFVNMMGRSNRKLSDIIDDLPKVFNTPEVRFFCEDEKKFEFIEKLKQKQLEKKKEIIDLDGIRVNSEDGWWLMRASNTQPSLVFRCEAKTRNKLHEIVNDLKKDVEIIDKKIAKQILT